MPDRPDWTPSTRQLPEDGATVMTMNSGGRVQLLRFSHSRWWVADMSMYVYYVPLFWRSQ